MTNAYPFIDFDEPSRPSGDVTGPSVNVSFTTNKEQESDVLVLTVADGNKLGTAGNKLDGESGGYLKHALASSGNFAGKRGQTMTIPAPKDSGRKTVVLLGIGNPEVLDAKSANLLGAPLYKALTATGHKGAHVQFDTHTKLAVSTEEAAANLADGVANASYKYTKLKTNAANAGMASVGMIVKSDAKARAFYEPLAAITKGQCWARDLTNEPGGTLDPQTYAKRIKNTLAPLGIKVKVIDEQEMEKLGMGSALSVGAGSADHRRGCMVVMEYDGTNGSQKKPFGLVGKGVTFDTGGISIKPGAGMHQMKMDMGGSAAVVGAMMALAGRKAKTNVVAIVGLTENMPDANATRPGDVVTSMSGKTIEVNNTDAEGRLVLADAMWHLQNEYKPRAMVEFSTLTGAIMAALGHGRAGMFTNSDNLKSKLEKAAKGSGEQVWHMPLDDEDRRAVQGSVADLQNLGGRFRGASTAAAFLENFVQRKEDGSFARPWAHMDIAGTAIPANGMASGYGVRLINQLVADNYEEKASSPSATKSAKRKPRL